MIVQGLWVGDALSTMERLSINSFLANGHDYHLYVYRDVSGVPEGATVLDASGIVSEQRIGNFSWLAEFSDLFRYQLLLEKGGIWADLDVVCLRPFQIRYEYLFPRTDHVRMLGRDEPENGIAIDGWFLKAPAGSPLMQICLERALEREGKKNPWGLIGPETLCNVATELGLLRYASHWKFFPINWKRYRDFTEVTPESEAIYSRFGHTALVIHLYREMWARNGLDVDATFDKRSIYEKLKARYLPDCLPNSRRQSAGRVEDPSGRGRSVRAWDREVLQEGEWGGLEEFGQACDAALADLSLMTPLRAFTSDVPNVICVVRDEALRLPYFLHHYKALGVTNIHIIDNGSTDETPRICADDSCVTLWRTEASYAAAAYGQLWVGAIARRYGLGKWVLNVDADEFLVYPGMNRHPLGDLQQWLASRGFTRLFGPLIDLYGSSRYGSAGWIDRRPLLARTPFYDGAGGCYQFRSTRYGPALAGGPRARLLSPDDPLKFCLSKFPLSYWSTNTAYANPHFPYPFDENLGEPFGALLHFKFLADFTERVDKAVAEGEHWNSAAEYHEYQALIKKEKVPLQARLFSKQRSRFYRGPHSLISAGLLNEIPWQTPAMVAEVGSGSRHAPVSSYRKDAAGAAENQAVAIASAAAVAELWARSAELKNAESGVDHRVTARSSILRYIPRGSIGAELGVFTGLFSQAILRQAAPSVLHLVDPWWRAYGEFFPDWGMYTDHGKLPTRVAQEAAVVRAEAARGACAVHCHVEFSSEWLRRLPDRSLDWAYLDSTHEYTGTLDELSLLRRKVRLGGYILGDDWDPNPAAIHHGVFRAVHDILRSDPDIEIVYAGSDHQYALRVRTPTAKSLRVQRPSKSNDAGDNDELAGIQKIRNAAAVDRSVTAVVTSCGRQDLLERMLDSFFKFNSYSMTKLIVIEDGSLAANAALIRKYAGRDITWLETGVRSGQIRAVDQAYASVEAPYIFHIEDDWEFFAGGFIEKSLVVLEALPDCIQVWIRALSDTNGHPLCSEIIMAGGVPVRRLELSFLGKWSGFSLNPGLRRTADYRRLGSYSEHVTDIGQEYGTAESALSEIYRKMGTYAVILADNNGRGYVRHVGWGRHIPPIMAAEK